MQTFNFPYHRISDEYPESSANIRFGGGYQFASRPRGPDQILTHLTFDAMWVLKVKATGVIDWTAAPQYNVLALQTFYEAHRMYEVFLYNHPTRGLTEWRFAKPFITPKSVGAGVVGGIKGFPLHDAHQVEGFQLDLLLQP